MAGKDGSTTMSRAQRRSQQSGRQIGRRCNEAKGAAIGERRRRKAAPIETEQQSTMDTPAALT